MQESAHSDLLRAGSVEGGESSNRAEKLPVLPERKQEDCGGETPLVVVGFACTYCAYTAADLAGALRLRYPPEVRIVQVPCTGRVDAGLLLRTFAEGADAVFVAGCNLGDCHFVDGNRRGKEEVARCRNLLAEVGLEPDRLEFFHIPASAGMLFARRAHEMVERVRILGPNPLRKTALQSYGEKISLPEFAGDAVQPRQFGRLVTQEERIVLTETSGTERQHGA